MKKPSWTVQWSHLELFWVWRNPQTARVGIFFSTEKMGRKKLIRFPSLWAFWGAQPRLLRCEYLICLQKSCYETMLSSCWLLDKTTRSQLCNLTAPRQEQEQAAESKDWSLCHHPNQGAEILVSTILQVLSSFKLKLVFSTEVILKCCAFAIFITQTPSSSPYVLPTFPLNYLLFAVLTSTSQDWRTLSFHPNCGKWSKPFVPCDFFLPLAFSAFCHHAHKKSHQVITLFFKSPFKPPPLSPLPTNHTLIAMHLATLAAAYSQLADLCLASQCLL